MYTVATRLRVICSTSRRPDSIGLASSLEAFTPASSARTCPPLSR